MISLEASNTLLARLSNNTKIGFLLLIFVSIASSCKSEKDTQQHDTPTSNTQINNEENSNESKYFSYYTMTFYKEDFIQTDSILKNTVNGYTYVKNIWEDSIINCFDKETSITSFFKLDSNKLFIETEGYKSGNIHIFNLKGKELFKYNLDYDSQLYYYNFTPINNKVYFYSETKEHITNTWVFDSKNVKNLGTEKPKELELFSSSNKTGIYYSPDSSMAVKIDFGSMSLINMITKEEKPLISLHPENFKSSWCFNDACWNDKGDKFYFDNSGDVACIWEIDLQKNTIDKIVPDHFAKLPVIIKDTLYYVLKGCIHKTYFIESGAEKILLNREQFDTITLDTLTKLNYRILPIEICPDYELLPNTYNVGLAVNANNKILSVKLLYSLNDSLFLQTTSLGYKYDGYSIDSTRWEYHDYNHTIDMNTISEDSTLYTEVFKLENYKLTYYITMGKIK